MKVKAHVTVGKGYCVAITASQWRSELEQSCEEYNQQHFASGSDEEPERSGNYLQHDREHAVVTVEFEVPDSVFQRQPPVEVPGTVVPNSDYQTPVMEQRNAVNRR